MAFFAHEIDLPNRKMPSRSEIIKAMQVIEMDPRDFYEQGRKAFGWENKGEPTQKEIDEDEEVMITEMLNVALVVSGVKNGALLTPDTMTPKTIKAYKDMGYFIHKKTWSPDFVVYYFSRKDPKIRSWNHETVGKFLSFMTPGDLEEMFKLPAKEKYGIGIEVQYRYKGGKIRKANELNQIVVGKTKKEIEAYLKPFVSALKVMPTPKELEIVKVTTKIERPVA